MKKLTMALLSLMLLLGLGTASAQLSAPTTTPADGATVAPGDNVTFWINDDYEAWTVIIYTFDPAVQLADVVVDGDLIGEIMDGGGKDGVKGCVLMAASGYAVDPSDPGAGATMAWAPGVTIPVDASGTITLQARATDVMGQNASSVATIHYTAEGEAAPVIAPTFSLADGTVVEANAKVSVLYDGPDREGTTMYKVLYVVDDPDFNFAQYDNFDDVPTKIIYTNPIAITKNTTITAITVKYDGVLEDIIGWSEKVSASYTVKPNEPDPTPVVKPAAPTFNPDGGAVTSGTKVLLTNGTEGDATPKPIYYNFKNNTDAFNEVKTQEQLTAAIQPGMFQKMMLYPAEGIEITKGTPINAATADIDADGHITWSEVITKNFTIGAADNTLVAPVFSPDGGEVDADDEITLTTTTTGAKIYYIDAATAGFVNLTTEEALDEAANGLMATAIEYSESMKPRLSDLGVETPGAKCSISAAAVLIAADGSLTWSEVTTKEFTVKGGEAPVVTVAIPVIAPGNDVVVHIGDLVTITCATDDAEIYYTTDGTNPYTEDKDGFPVAVKEGALKYTEPFELTAEMLIKQGQVYALLIRAVAVKGDAISENGAAAGYVVYPDAPAFSPVAGAVKEGTEVTITCVPAVADIYYTTDGTTPTMENSAKYTEPIKVTEDMTIKAIAVLGQYQASASAAYTIMEEATPVELTFNPASGSEVEENTEVTITANQEVEIFYMMFESEEAAKAAEWDQEKALSYSAELKPVLTADKNTLKVAYALEGAEAVESEFFYATYTVKTLPAIELTFNPAPGSEVEEGTEVTVTASRETEIFYNVYASKEAADADEAFMANAKEVGEDGMPVITKEATYLRCAVSDKGEMVYFDAAYTIKTANEDLELVGVSVYPNPSNGVFNIELPVAATIEVFASNGMLCQRVKALAGNATLNINRSGIYVLRITGEGRTAVKRIIVR